MDTRIRAHEPGFIDQDDVPLATSDDRAQLPRERRIVRAPGRIALTVMRVPRQR